MSDVETLVTPPDADEDEGGDIQSARLSASCRRLSPPDPLPPRPGVAEPPEPRVSGDRVEFDRLPREPERSIWCDWMRRHGVDPNDVAVPGWIERHPDTYRLAYESYELGEDGLPVWDREQRDAVRVTRIFQMEGPPSPFPMEESLTETECPLTELPPSQCACPRHRGGAAPGDELIGTVGQAFEAAYDGRCERGDDQIRAGQMIARVADGSGYVHAVRCPR